MGSTRLVLIAPRLSARPSYPMEDETRPMSRSRKKTKRSNSAAKATPEPSGGKRSRQTRRETRRRARQRQQLGTVGLLAVLIVAVAAVGFLHFRGDAGAQAVALELADPALGPEDAPITIVEYGDFGCPSCRAWHRAGVREAIMQKYGDSVRFVWKDFPVITPNSTRAAEAGQCAAAQGRFWPYHDYVYDTLADWRELKPDNLVSYATAVGLDEAAFRACLEGGHTSAKVRENLQSARRLNLRGTPSFVFNGEVLTGPPSYQVLESLILAALP
ncbi:MAG: hypothetical protein D6775_08710 [Caldilineae bacterium]|nr:MAG: hypothetical protein D6775_08710 [Caldilineae bacterium]